MDKEKLLAARKKLKEYQLHKKDYVHEHQESSRNNDEGPDAHSILSDVSYQIENNERNSCPPEEEIGKMQSTGRISASKDELTLDEDSNQFINKPNYNFASTASFMDKIGCVENDLHLNKPRAFVKNDLLLEENNKSEAVSCYVSDVQTRFNTSLEMNFKQSNYHNESSEVGLLNDSFFLQKEHLLQMASSVAEVLVDVNHSSTSESLSNLIDKKQFLTTCLQEQTKLVNQLHGEVSRHSCRVSELEAKLTAKDAEFEAKILLEINPLKEQLQLHAHTTGILVAEKAELSATIAQCYGTIKQKTELIEDLSGKLKSYQLHVAELEKGTANFKCSSEETNRAYQQLLQDYEKLMDNLSQLRKEKEDMELESSELKQKLSLKNTELTNLQHDLQERNAMLSLNEIKIQQLSNSFQQVQSLENGHQTAMVLEQQLTQLKEALTTLNNEKDEASKQYQNYVEQLDERYKKVISELDASRKQIVELESREQSYIQRLFEMEQELKREREKVESLKPLLEHKDRIEILTRSIDNLVMEQESHQLTLSRKDAEIEVLNKELQELLEIKEHSLDASRLATALESEQLGASRAVFQNQQLKHQLNEMHDAFVLLSNSKLDLTEQLQAERGLSKKLTLQLSQYESQLQELENQLKEKEATLIELKKEKLFNAQIADKMQHYEAQFHHSHTLQQELKNSQILMEGLKKENKQLREELNRQKEDMIVKNLKFIELTDEQYSSTPISNGNESNDPICAEIQASQTEHFDIPEPLKKLESRFKEAMEKVAELTDEKQRLEHIVLQLQGETETIGEYVTLYQRQRSILQEKTKEREQSFRQLSEQRNHQQEQLHKLKLLVANLFKKKYTNSAAIVDYDGNIQLTCLHNKENLEGAENRRLNPDKIICSEEVEDNVDLKDETASQIFDILSEIKDYSDVCILEPNFHPCPWCSGKLITV